MFLNIIGYESNNFLFDSQIRVDYKLNDKLYRFFKKPTMVFMPQWVYDKLNPKIQNNLSISFGEDDDKTVDELLSTDVLTVLIEDDFDPYTDMMIFVEELVGEQMQYLVIEDIE